MCLRVAPRHVEDEHGQQRHSKDDTTARGSYDELKTAVGQEVGLGITCFCCIGGQTTMKREWDTYRMR